MISLVVWMEGIKQSDFVLYVNCLYNQNQTILAHADFCCDCWLFLLCACILCEIGSYRFLPLSLTGKALTNVIAIGVGGSFLGPLFMHACSSNITNVKLQIHVSTQILERVYRQPKAQHMNMQNTLIAFGENRTTLAALLQKQKQELAGKRA
ncbi:hypothetical protein L1987_62326 [Smallanthus sonchifolius]|uniref:Uncharacterized protein n=1 Tax=Smallanthus sonchifolius TaxID=185202 RepID=A0ACB9CA85_9ASTR|nr:hypothetical protein L1987_62326 [Smallanthus sonchifolius]